MVIIDLILLVAFLSCKCKSSFQVPAHTHTKALDFVDERKVATAVRDSFRHRLYCCIVDRFTFHPINRPIKAIIQPKKTSTVSPHRRPVSHINSFSFSFGFERPKFNVLLNRAHIRRRPLSSRGRRRRMWPSVFSLYTSSVCPGQRCVCADVYPGPISPWLPPKVLDKIRGAERSIPQRSGAAHKSRQSSAPNPSAGPHQ